MNRYLVINFNRYETDSSTESVILAEKPNLALIQFLKNEFIICQEELDEQTEYVNNNIVDVRDNFSCISGDENDYLVYLIG